jgi:hypothetical protein
MEIIIYRDTFPSRFYLWKTSEECENIQAEFESLSAEYPNWDIEIITADDVDDILSFIKKKN